MKKLLLIFLYISTNHVYGYQYNDNSVVTFADVLIWRVKEISADNWAQIISPSGFQQTAKLLGVPFDWSTGFRVGLGYTSAANAWDTVFYYTRYQTTATTDASGNIYSSFLGNFYADNLDGVNFEPYYSSAALKWDFSFNNFDLELGRSFDIDDILVLRPFVGLKAVVINQDIHTNWYNPTLPTTPPMPGNFMSSKENLKHDFWGIGPALGLNTTWFIYDDAQYAFNLFGNFSGAFLYGHWQFKDVFEDNTPITITINSSDINGAAPMGRALMGVEWAGYIFQANLTIRLGYEAQVWFNQLQYYSLNGGRLDSIMSLQGGVIDFCINF